MGEPGALLGRLLDSAGAVLRHPKVFGFSRKFTLWPGPESGLVETYLLFAFAYFAEASLNTFVFPKLLGLRSVQHSKPRKNQMREDISTSLVTLLIKSVISLLCEEMHARGWSRTFAHTQYNSFTSFFYLIVTLCLIDVLMDSWFFWSHRLLHWGPLYRAVHYQHHRAVAPTAFSTYNMHPIEAIILFGAFPIFQLTLPVSARMLRIYRYIDMATHQGGHAGNEMAPFAPYPAAILSLLFFGLRCNPILATVQHHDQHHRVPTKNFGLLFTHWDRLCGTLHATYDRELFWYWDKRRLHKLNTMEKKKRDDDDSSTVTATAASPASPASLADSDVDATVLVAPTKVMKLTGRTTAPA